MTAILLDIEGTTTPLSFVSAVLTPYSIQALPGFLATKRTEPAIREAMLMVLADATEADSRRDELETVLAVCRRQIAADVKATGLKQLQGMVWSSGYSTGKLRGQLFPDVHERLKAWRAEGRAVGIFSSGSRLAQQLLFKYSDCGDLSGAINAYFDTTTGPKRSSASYTAIAAKLGYPAEEITFATDQPAEADAAAQAGLQTALIMRPGNSPLPAQLAHPVHADLTHL